MSDEIKYFNVKNTSLRLVHIGGVMVVPDQVARVVDDEKGINRHDVELSEYLEFTDEDVDVIESEPVKNKAKPKQGTAKSNTPTGSGWSSKQ